MKSSEQGFTLIELLAPLALFFPRFRWIFLAVIVPFHILSLPFFSLIFYQNLVLLAFLLLPTVVRSKD